MHDIEVPDEMPEHPVKKRTDDQLLLFLKIRFVNPRFTEKDNHHIGTRFSEEKYLRVNIKLLAFFGTAIPLLPKGCRFRIRSTLSEATVGIQLRRLRQDAYGLFQVGKDVSCLAIYRIL